MFYLVSIDQSYMTIRYTRNVVKEACPSLEIPSYSSFMSSIL